MHGTRSPRLALLRPGPPLSLPTGVPRPGSLAGRGRLLAKLLLAGLFLLVALLPGVGPLQGQEEFPGAPGAASRAGPYPVDPLAVPRPTLRALALEGSDRIEVDGRLDEAAWGRADSTATPWIQTQPHPGHPAAHRTVVRILYDREALYIGAFMSDEETEGLVVPGLEQDFSAPDSDMFAVLLDTYHDRQNGFLFGVNPAGALYDAQAFNDQATVIPAWEGIVEVRTRVHDDGWTAELAIPFTTLRFAPSDGPQTWGLNFLRRNRRLNEDSMWAPLPVQFRLYKTSQAGTLEGLDDLPRPRNLYLKPYLLGNRLDGAERGSSAWTGDVGADLKWGMTSRLTLDLTVNTDFSQVEVDQEQVNLTRASLFFPEKRDFFLENEGTFGFQDLSIRQYRTGSSARRFRLFHSRRIGVSDDREILPILGGARLTGRVGERLEVGFLDMQTRSVDGPGGAVLHPAENFAVGRVKTHLPGGSYVGGMFVNRQETGLSDGEAGYNRAWGVDGRFNLLGNMVVSTYLAETRDRFASSGDHRTGMFQAAWRSSFWNVSVLAKHVGDAFDPEAGFVARRGIRRLFGTLGVHPRIQDAGIFEVNPYLDMDVFTDLDGAMETRTLTPGVGVTFLDGGTLTVEVADRYERLDQATRIAGGTVPTGTYEWREATARYQLPGSRQVWGTLSVSGGDFYDGDRTSVSADVGFRPSAHLSLELGAQHNDLELGGEAFTADLFDARIRWARDVRTFLMVFVQYNESTEELISNLRFNLIHAPLSDLFLVFTERRSLADGPGGGVRVRGLTLKLTRLLAL